MTRALAGILLTAALAPAQDLSLGKILVATRKSRDPDLARSVILLVRHDRQATTGLFLNRPLTIPLSEVYPELTGAQRTLYAGGPVTIGIRALYRSRSPLDGATRVTGDVWMISTKTPLAKLASAGAPSSTFRVYSGYTGWSPGQLQDEIARGLWYLVPADAGKVFDPHPETLWQRLVDLHFSIRNMFEKSSVHARNPG